MGMLYRLIYGLFFAALVLIGALLIATLIPVPGNYEVKIVQSGSMEPSIPVGSMVVVKPRAPYKIGDVITFGEDTQGRIPTTHRIVEVREEGGETRFVTKGDANEVADPETTLQADVIGKVLLAVPYAGFVLDFARTPLGFGVLIGIPALIVILEEVGSIVGEARRIRVRRKRMRGNAMQYEDIQLDNRKREGEGGD